MAAVCQCGNDVLNALPKLFALPGEETIHEEPKSGCLACAILCEEENEARKREIGKLRQDYNKLLDGQSDLEQDVQEATDDVRRVQQELSSVRRLEVQELKYQLFRMKEIQLAKDAAFENQIRLLREQMDQLPAMVAAAVAAASASFASNGYPPANMAADQSAAAAAAAYSAGYGYASPTDQMMYQPVMLIPHPPPLPPHTPPLTAEALASLPEQQRKQVLAQHLYPLVLAHQTDMAGAITERIVDVQDPSAVLPLLNNPDSLRTKMEVAAMTIAYLPTNDPCRMHGWG